MNIDGQDRFMATAFPDVTNPFRLLAESVVDYAIYLVDPSGLIASWNVGAERITGYTAGEVIGQRFEMMFGPEDRASGKPVRDLAAGLAGGKFDEVGQRPRKDGTLFWAMYTLTALREGARHVGFAVLVRDITEHRQHEARVRENEERLRTALTAGRMGTWAWDIAANRSVWNEREYELFDLPPSGGSVDTDRFFERVHPDDIAALRKRLEAAVKNESEFRMDFRILRPNGDVRWLAGAGRVSRDARGRASAMYGVNFDISEQRAAEAALLASEERLRLFMDQTPAQVWMDDEDGVNCFANRALLHELGRPAEAVVGHHIADFLPEGVPVDSYLANNAQVFASGAHDTAIVRAPRHDGTVGQFLVHKFPMGTSAEGRRLLGGVAVDVTERERAVQALAASEERFRLLVESVKDFAIYTLDLNGVIETWNAAAARLYGYSADEIIGQHRSVLFTADDLARGLPQQELELARATGKASEETWRRRKDGSLFWSNGTMSALYDGEGTLRGFVKVIRDLTERKRALDALEEVQQRLELATQSARIGIWEWNVLTNELVWDSRMYELYGVSVAEFSGAYDAWQRGLHPEDRAASEAALAAALHGEQGFHFEFRIVRPDGEVRDVEAHGQVRRASDGTATHVIGLNRDITERKQAERGLRLRDRAIQAVSQGILITDPNLTDNPIIYASRGFEQMTGYDAPSTLGRNSRFLQGEHSDPATVRVLQEAIAAGRECSVEILNYKQDGTPFWNALFITPIRADNGTLLHFVGVQADVTERRTLERAFQQAQRMESVGRLAGGVAHDFNNLLTVISGCSDLLLLAMSQSDSNRDLVTEIHRAGERAAALTRQLLAFSRKQVIAPVPLDLNEVVTQTYKMLARLLGEDVIIATVLSPKLPRVLADPGQMDQVLMNLCVNARDAMPTGGRVTIETREFVLEDEMPAYPDLAPGRYVQLSVTDTGHGMSDEVKSKVFEPFFTTKDSGKGTGLGLATVFGIVAQHHGRISVYSELGIGTTFKIFFPASEASASSAAEPPSAPLPRGSETILLVDDDAAVRRIARISLETQGYRVLEAGGGAEAIRVASEYAGVIHLLMTDVVMPAMSGRQLADALHSSRSGLKVLFMSGYTDDAVMRHGILEGTKHFLQKPFAPLGIAKKVRAVLDES